MNLYDHITSILEQNKKFCIDGKLLKNSVIESALKLEHDLLQILINDNIAKSNFFESINGILIFDKIKFQKFVANKQFLPDSFTAFKNKIGLTAETEFISDTKDVVLDWPYKDCVLEGGQTKENHKKQEIFWNETLAADTIDRLFDAKAFENWKKYDHNGCHEIDNLSIDDNFIIKGNNLIALHSLKKVYKERIKLIYIDPPYNTKNGSFQYNDSFNHSTWLTFMKNRLEVAWTLLRPDGTFFIQVDDEEFAYLKILCDEVFGREHFRETIVLKSSTESGVNAVNVKRGERLFKVKEYILFYSKSASFRFKPFYSKANFNVNYKYEVVKCNDVYKVTNLSKTFKDKFEKLDISAKEKTLLVNNAFEEYALNNAKDIYSLEKNLKKAGAKLKIFAQANKEKNVVEEYVNTTRKIKLIFDGGEFVSLQERIIVEDNKKYFGVLASDLWTDIGTTPSSEGGVKFSNGKKPEKLLSRIIEMTTEKNDIILDYHLGSGTTAAVAHKMGRRYIGLEQMDYGENDSVQRLQNVINGDQSGISKNVKWNGGGTFIYCELAKNNAAAVAKINALISDEEILTAYIKTMENQFVNYNLNTSILKENITEFQSLSTDLKKKILIDFLDKNELYVHYSEINDQTANLSDGSRSLTQKFYNLNL